MSRSAKVALDSVRIAEKLVAAAAELVPSMATGVSETSTVLPSMLVV